MFVYLLHFDEYLSHAGHYLGITEDLAKRMERHAAGTGAVITSEIKTQGIGFQLVRAWEAESFDAERIFKKQKNGPRFCPICHPHDYQKTIKGLTTISKVILERSGIKTIYNAES